MKVLFLADAPALSNGTKTFFAVSEETYRNMSESRQDALDAMSQSELSKMDLRQQIKFGVCRVVYGATGYNDDGSKKKEFNQIAKENGFVNVSPTEKGLYSIDLPSRDSNTNTNNSDAIQKELRVFASSDEKKELNNTQIKKVEALIKEGKSMKEAIELV